ncbi:heme-binding domain-containing protein [Christiangramia marina]|uniref:Heme-binding domain-containing protein n=1 Tax=Christiangramia sediminicola TaxID=3073267 RepID=A0ABU1EU13_9FLAO|nr:MULTISPECIES: heme-binding domain-containing protein [unclassified Christiangramia]MDR5591884.1 heme-binding domain-containing protein [Christiangramia sp. SM2212]TQI69678.1 heme-binding protein [Gramella sp. Hel_I_59]
MKFLKIIAWIALVALVVIQFFPVTLNESDTIPQSDFMLVNKVPATIKNQLQVSCYDCHSNNTDYPSYSKIQPAAWFLEDHIKEGKDELNFNEWDTYSSRRKNSKLRSIIKQIESGEMPLVSYTLIHGGARLDSTAVKEIIGYMESLQKD